MKKINLYLAGILLLINVHTYGQFVASNTQPCEGQLVTISLQGPFNSGICDSDPTLYIGPDYYEFHVTYSGGSYNIASGVENVATNNASLSLGATPYSYTSPGTMEVLITRYKKRVSDSQLQECGTQSLYINPRKTITFSGPIYLESLGVTTYSVTNVAGVNFTWNLPSGWTIVNHNSNYSSIDVSPTSAGTITVTSSIPISACGWPISIPVTLSPCFNRGYTDFDFCLPQTNWGNIFLSSSFNDENKWPRMMGDFNGDDKDDLIAFGDTQVAVGLSSGSNFSTSVWTNAFTFGLGGSTQQTYPRRLGDFNGDGKDDIVSFGDEMTVVGLSTGSSFSTSGFSTSPYFTHQQGFTSDLLPRLVGDFNGDGKDDVIGFGYSSTSVGISTGTSFNVSGWNGGYTFSYDGGFVNADKYPRMIGDFNGDGKDDVIGFGHTSVAVGLSTGTSFNNSIWTNAFTYGNDNFTLQSNTPRAVGDFDGDGKDDIIMFSDGNPAVGISTGTSFSVSNWPCLNGAHSSLHHYSNSGQTIIEIKDVNADGKDDIVAFEGYNGTHVFYSTGSTFMCEASDEDMMDLEGNYDVRFVGNFDNTDDQLEIVAIGTSNLKVLDCAECTTSVAKANMMNYYSVNPETSGSNTVDVYKYCVDDTVKLDLSATTCEDRYYFEIKPYNLSTGTTSAAVYQTGWIIQNAPQFIDFSNVQNLQMNQLYMLTYGVGPNLSTKSFIFKITGSVANFTDNPYQTRVLVTTNNPSGYTIEQYYNNALYITTDGTSSACYDEYHYSVIEVAPPFMIPNSNAVPVQQIPSGGGWNAGPITVQHVDLSGILLGKIYRIQLQVRKNGVTSTLNRYVERTSTNYVPPKGKNLEISDSNTETPNSVLFPNPATDDIIIQPVGYKEENISGEIYDSYGKLVENVTLQPETEQTIDLLGFAPGIYLMVLKGNDRIETIRFIKK